MCHLHKKITAGLILAIALVGALRADADLVWSAPGPRGFAVVPRFDGLTDTQKQAAEDPWAAERTFTIPVQNRGVKPGNIRRQTEKSIQTAKDMGLREEKNGTFTDEKGNKYTIDKEGFLIDKDGKRMEGVKSDKKAVLTADPTAKALEAQNSILGAQSEDSSNFLSAATITTSLKRSEQSAEKTAELSPASEKADEVDSVDTDVMYQAAEKEYYEHRLNKWDAMDKTFNKDPVYQATQKELERIRSSNDIIDEDPVYKAATKELVENTDELWAATERAYDKDPALKAAAEEFRRAEDKWNAARGEAYNKDSTVQAAQKKYSQALDELDVAEKKVIDKDPAIQAAQKEYSRIRDELNVARREAPDKDPAVQAAQKEYRQMRKELWAATERAYDKDPATQAAQKEDRRAWKELDAAEKRAADKDPATQATQKEYDRVLNELDAAKKRAADKDPAVQAAQKEYSRIRDELWAARREAVNKDPAVQAASKEHRRAWDELDAAEKRAADKDPATQAAQKEYRRAEDKWEAAADKDPVYKAALKEARRVEDKWEAAQRKAFSKYPEYKTAPKDFARAVERNSIAKAFILRDPAVQAAVEKYEQADQIYDDLKEKRIAVQLEYNQRLSTVDREADERVSKLNIAMDREKQITSERVATMEKHFSPGAISTLKEGIAKEESDALKTLMQQRDKVQRVLHNQQNMLAMEKDQKMNLANAQSKSRELCFGAACLTRARVEWAQQRIDETNERAEARALTGQPPHPADSSAIIGNQRDIDYTKAAAQRLRAKALKQEEAARHQYEQNLKSYEHDFHEIMKQNAALDFSVDDAIRQRELQHKKWKSDWEAYLSKKKSGAK